MFKPIVGNLNLLAGQTSHSSELSTKKIYSLGALFSTVFQRSVRHMMLMLHLRISLNQK